MSDFVDECRREWERLQVPAPVANEMAADLAADLKEAEAEGVSAEEVLGSGAFDARSFAAAWAAERGVIPSSAATVPVQVSRRPRRSRLLAAAAASVLLALLGLALLTARPTTEQRLALVRSVGPVPRGAGQTWVPQPGPFPRFGPLRREVLPAGVVTARVDRVNFAVHTIGLIFLFIGIAGLIVTLLYWSPWNNGRRASGIA